MVRIRRFGVARTATVFALWTLAFGLIFFIPFAIVVLAAGDITTTDAFGNEVTFPAGAAVIFFLVIVAVYAGFGWIFTAISLLIYNLVAGWVGGVQMELVNVHPQYPPQPAPATQYPQPQPQPQQTPPPQPPQPNQPGSWGPPPGDQPNP